MLNEMKRLNSYSFADFKQSMEKFFYMNEVIDPGNTFSKIHIQNLFQDKHFNVPDEP
jgi:hypothetical protein